MKPKLMPHKHNESNCIICKNYLNRLQKYRQSISRGALKSKKLQNLSRTSNSNKARRGKRKFDLPKPVLARPAYIFWS